MLQYQDTCSFVTLFTWCTLLYVYLYLYRNIHINVLVFIVSFRDAKHNVSTYTRIGMYTTYYSILIVLSVMFLFCINVYYDPRLRLRSFKVEFTQNTNLKILPIDFIIWQLALVVLVGCPFYNTLHLISFSL